MVSPGAQHGWHECSSSVPRHPCPRRNRRLHSRLLKRPSRRGSCRYLAIDYVADGVDRPVASGADRFAISDPRGLVLMDGRDSTCPSRGHAVPSRSMAVPGIRAMASVIGRCLGRRLPLGRAGGHPYGVVAIRPPAQTAWPRGGRNGFGHLFHRFSTGFGGSAASLDGLP
jgi:hypothetical protein